MTVFIFIAILLSAALAVEGSKLYDSQIEFCCDGETFFRGVYESSRLLVCCSQNVTAYTDKDCLNDDIIKQECCGGKLSPIPLNGTFECCGEEHIDLGKYFCHQGVKTDLAKRNENVGRTLLCGDDPTNHSNFYNDKNNEICCGGEIYYNELLGCCGEEVYNKYTQICCRDFMSLTEPDENLVVDTIADITNFSCPRKNYRCCNKQFMNLETQVCCKDGPTETYNNTRVEYCCGNDFVYDEKTEICVFDKIESRKDFQNVCSNQIYNQNEHFCHKGKLYPVGEGERFCVSELRAYSVSKELCCPDGIHKKEREAQNSCCFKDKFDFYDVSQIAAYC